MAARNSAAISMPCPGGPSGHGIAHMYRTPDRCDERGVVTEIGGYIDVGECPDHWAHWDQPSKIKHLAAEATGTQPGPDWDNWDQARLDASGVGIGTHGSGSRGSLPEAASTRRRSLQGSAVLALDLGQNTGWALRTADGVITSGTVQFRPGRFEGGGMVLPALPRLAAGAGRDRRRDRGGALRRGPPASRHRGEHMPTAVTSPT